jgi:hypothetical protein
MLAADVERSRKAVRVAIRGHATAGISAAGARMTELVLRRRCTTRAGLASKHVALDTFDRVDDRVRTTVCTCTAIFRSVTQDRAPRAAVSAALAAVRRAVVRPTAELRRCAGRGWIILAVAGDDAALLGAARRRGRRIGRRRHRRVGPALLQRRVIVRRGACGQDQQRREHSHESHSCNGCAA